ncbi:MAG: hypothetical protein JWQ88_441 [Rhodoferax sp.]|nr:hypothetical protein [Rhodoferax sp.]
MKKILFVCTANVCRSPMAHAVAAQLVARQGLFKAIQVDSAGTHASNGASQPDGRARTALEKRGYKVSKGKSRRVEPRDFERFDLILAMDLQNLKFLQSMCPAKFLPKLKLFLTSATGGIEEVPDPYYGNAEGFERVLDLCESGVSTLLTSLAT